MEEYIRVECADCLDAGLIEKSMFGQTWVEACHCQASVHYELTGAVEPQD